ncbi:ZZ-type zinc finger-containing protein 3 [Liparis tanakae]|uniref:ZZ-type zinc finger-containing protein 3 n=1 Tax=Liparis tanakae TaxID=230148 RepID=A0A4Z2JFW9_9TELE|nr:ZZ-type zinc finger-containing protein 3 [Liparis tanakae]
MHRLGSESLMHCSIANVRLNNVGGPSLRLLSNLAPLRVSYQRLLQTIGVLEAQRTQAILDLETLARHQREALVDPITFVEQLQKQVHLDLPCPQRVVQLPDIGWTQYTSGLGDFEREFCDKKRKTRRLKLIFDQGTYIFVFVLVCLLDPKVPWSPKKKVNRPPCTRLCPLVTLSRTAGTCRYGSGSFVR